MSVRQLPHIVVFNVHESIIVSIVEKWELLCLQSFHRVKSLFKDCLDLLEKEYFGRFSNSGLLSAVK